LDDLITKLQMKRLFDIIISFLALIVLSPVLMLIAVIIKTNSKGPIFFRQKRVGRSGKQFILYKFRSMTLFQLAEEGLFEPGDISRVTAVGKFFRKSKLDELPQLINVLIGDMSLVGPRPEVPNWVAVYPEAWKIVLTIRPGMTDNASIMFQDEESILAAADDPEQVYREIILPKKLELYIDYVDKHSFHGDILILLRTLKVLRLYETNSEDPISRNAEDPIRKGFSLRERIEVS
jgi:lipopolysaccharide/colanic/teichoic acid biosynthesis glycosyltransferase